MATPPQVQPAPDPYARVAGPTHTILVLVILGVWALLGAIAADQMRVAGNPHRALSYVVALIFEWLVFLFVVAGVRRSGAPLHIVLGDRWHSVRQVLRDIGIAAGFWIFAMVLLGISGRLLRVSPADHSVQYMLPQGSLEIALWIALSITAGICEETICRGYLQRQFIALTKSVPAGILLSAVAFGAVHAYQGFRRMILIGLFGAMFGILAHRRKSVRPGMIAHAWHDGFLGVLASVMRH
jgi:membrane protease YdiL (CAAX protease family)